ncbi:hypothetical protein QRX60_28650 [Amycolatopsis mongoliensis]|uniref:Transmembrane protein n=1 Tax=Amycolatopsis mongoliensis TaxID=715475 RepID=A0A9Y2JIK8_9PSEU|nr:hypothetical protein [Amycolatopsis sp. 4-36]WIX98041.1 hypothetical protein QRX60_28650 [Amycolatopsis sp. 4-36]
MTVNRLGKVQQLILLCALAVSVVAMHHFSVAVGRPGAAGMTATQAMSEVGLEAVAAPPMSGSGEHDPGMPNRMQDMLHLCLAVLCAAGALLLALVAFLGLSWFTTRFPRSPQFHGSPRRGRPPDGCGRSILTSLCVLRT